MNYYPHHIGDFNNATRHLTRIERSIYRDLMDLYYDKEQPLILDLDKLCRLVIARTDEERTAVEQVLNEFFTETEQGWRHSRCDEEITKYRESTAAKSAAGKASAAKRAAQAAKEQQKANNSLTDVEQTLNSRSTDDDASLSLRSTNQNQNHNQNNIKDILSEKSDNATKSEPTNPPTKPKKDEPNEKFMLFWKAWPSTARKTDRKKCWHKWRNKKLDEIADRIINHVQVSKQSNEQWRDGFEPSPLTYLNNERWADNDDDPNADWWLAAGFENQWVAENAGCTKNTAKHFRNGQRLEEALV